jgi:hypothetical protein
MNGGGLDDSTWTWPRADMSAVALGSKSRKSSPRLTRSLWSWKSSRGPEKPGRCGLLPVLELDLELADLVDHRSDLRHELRHRGPVATGGGTETRLLFADDGRGGALQSVPQRFDCQLLDHASSGQPRRHHNTGNNPSPHSVPLLMNVVAPAARSGRNTCRSC